MRIGIPRETKIHEGRVALIPEACAELVQQGHDVAVESGAGHLSGYDDDSYRQHGVTVVENNEALYACSRLIIKVKEPQPDELGLLTSDHLLFSYLHLAAAPQLLAGLLERGLTAIAFETVTDGHGLPLLAPMSDIAGRLAVHIGTTLLHQHHHGRGVMLGGIPGAERGKVVILGAGVAGGNACEVAQALGAEVVIFDHNRDKQSRMRALGQNVTALYPFPAAIEEHVAAADLLIGAVLIPGARAPHLVPRDWVAQMRAGSVIIDIAVDQGGCIETTRPTTYESPTFVWSDIVHFGVTNMPGAVPRTASQALSAALLPYILRLVKDDWQSDPALQAGINVASGEIRHPALKKATSDVD